MATDDGKNIHTVQRRNIQRVEAPSGRYKPDESSIELLTISATELIDGIRDLKVMLGDNQSLGRNYKFFEISHPQDRNRDFHLTADDPDSLYLGIEARSAFYPPIPGR